MTSPHSSQSQSQCQLQSTSHIHSILLLPEHITPSSPSSQPPFLLLDIQSLLNRSYTQTYCAHPTLFGTTHLRLASPTQLAAIIGTTGFTVILVRDGQVVATGSAKDFGDGDVTQYVRWSRNLSGSEWMAKEGGVDSRTTGTSRGSGWVDGTVGVSVQQLKQQREGEDSGIVTATSNDTPTATPTVGIGESTTSSDVNEVLKYEITAFAVAPEAQASGLGARVLREIEWLVLGGGIHLARAVDAPATSATLALQDTTSITHINGIDIDQLRLVSSSTAVDGSAAGNRTGAGGNGDGDGATSRPQPKLVLIGIKELGNEAYYLRRGFKNTWTGVLPVGMWDAQEQCTMVYMEKEASDL